MKTFYLNLFLVLSIACPGLPLQAQSVEPTAYYPMQNWDTSPYKSYRFNSAERSGDFINFRMLFPNSYDSTATNAPAYPLLVVLHGAGESARMEWDNGSKTNSPYPEGDPRIDNNDHHLFYGGTEHLKAVKSGRFPGFIIFPQNFYGTWIEGRGGADSGLYKDLQKTLELIDYLAKELNVDSKRIYIHGLSNGGAGTWYAAYKRPNLFAATLPMSAPGDPAMATAVAGIPLWVFQGADDPSPRPSETKKTVEAIRNAGGSVRYTEYAETGHNTWNKAYREEDFFEWMLSQQKGEASNQPPGVNAGEDKSVQLPTSSTTFKATASDPDGSIDTYRWEKISGPTVNLKNTETAALSLSELVEGSYSFQITVVDDQGASASDQVNLQVYPAENKAPFVNAGADKSVVLPENITTFTASASDPDGTVSSYQWTKLSGPAATLSNTESATLSLSDLLEGEYAFQVKVIDNGGAEATDEVKLTVYASAPANRPPEVNAGDDQLIHLPTNTASFTAEASDPDGRIESWLWEQLSGPEASMSGADSPTITLDALEAGTYRFRLTVTDNGRASASDELSLQVILTSGINSEEMKRLVQLTAFPNPSTGVVFLRMESAHPEPLVITVLNSYGTTISRTETSAQLPGEEPFRLDLSPHRFLPGPYFIQVRDKEGRYRETLILLKQ